MSEEHERDRSERMADDPRHEARLRQLFGATAHRASPQQLDRLARAAADVPNASSSVWQRLRRLLGQPRPALAVAVAVFTRTRSAVDITVVFQGIEVSGVGSVGLVTSALLGITPPALLRTSASTEIRAIIPAGMVLRLQVNTLPATAQISIPGKTGTAQ